MDKICNDPRVQAAFAARFESQPKETPEKLVRRVIRQFVADQVDGYERELAIQAAVEAHAQSRATLDI